MVFGTSLTLFAFNFTLSQFFVGQHGDICFSVNQLTQPETLIDFGDGNFYNSSKNHSLLECEKDVESFSSRSCVNHTYYSSGTFLVYFNLSHSVGSFFHSEVVIVEEPILGIKLMLLSSSVVPLFEEIVVKCTVESGSNIVFDWDFGDDTDGQYTMVESFQNSSIAHHSYGIADTYNVSVHVQNSHQSVLAILDATIQAVEAIEQLHLRPISGHYAVPLFDTGQINNSSFSYSTDWVVFEAWVWRGSDLEFLFDYGDGFQEMVPSVLNVWSVPCALGKHRYTSEGKYWVIVTAINLLDSVNETLEKPFYVQFLPENLSLNKSIYIIPNGRSIILHATISRGTNVSFNWIVGDDQHLNNTGDSLTLSSLLPGNYIVHVEAFNQVTDFGYNTPERPTVSARIYVQDILQSILLCVKLNDQQEICGEENLDLPLDESIKLEAKVVPSTKAALKYIWQLGLPELKKTSTPVLIHHYRDAGWYNVNVTAQNHISSVSSTQLRLHLVQKIANLTAIHFQGPNLVNQSITFQALYWFGTNLTFEWLFGDGSSPVLTLSPSVQHLYTKMGEYWVTLNVWNKFSQASITTNLFFLNYICKKPEISFLHGRKTRFVKSSEDILIEVNVITSCKSANVSYTWTVHENKSGIPFELSSFGIPSQHQLIIPCCHLKPGSYNVQLKVEMVGTIVYATAYTTFQVQPPQPHAVIYGGFVRFVGRMDYLEMQAGLNVNEMQSHYNAATSWSYDWSCLPMVMKHLGCFQSNPPSAFSQNNLSNFLLPSHLFNPNLMAVELNVSIIGEQKFETSQVVEIVPKPHALIIDINCRNCKNHYINSDEKVIIQADCKQSLNVQYSWNIWLIQDFNQDFDFSNQECVQADGSTFFIMAPNTTDHATINDTDAPQMTNISGHSSEPEFFTDDLPSLPKNPEIPEFNSKKVFKSQNRDSLFIPKSTSIPLEQFPIQGEDVYGNDDNLTSFPYPEFLPLLPIDDHPLGSPDSFITEEGVPGESGSAAARDQSRQNFKIVLPDDDDQDILEEAGNRRIPPGVNNGLNTDTNEMKGDPVKRKNLDFKPAIPHLVKQPRLLLSVKESDTASGLHSQFLILKPGVLITGKTYIIQAIAEDADDSSEGTAMEYVKVRVGPLNGRCTLMPLSGNGVSSDFRMHCFEWKSGNTPFFFTLRYSLRPEEEGHLLYFGLNRIMKFTLPPGLQNHNYSVYLSVAVQDNYGATTKVCSLTRQVYALKNLSIRMEQYIYNETSHPNSSLQMFLGQKQYQVLLGRIHILMSSLNAEFVGKVTSDLDTENLRNSHFRVKIPLLFMEIIDHLKIFSKVEAVQVLSVLREIILDAPNVSVQELQAVFRLFTKIYKLKHKLFGPCPPQALEREIMKFLSKLAYTSTYLSVKDEAIEIFQSTRELQTLEIKETMKVHFETKEPYQIDILNLFAHASYLTRGNYRLPFSIPLKQAQLYLPHNAYVSLDFDKSANFSPFRCSKNCGTMGNCTLLIAQEFDYVSAPYLEQHASNFEKITTSLQFYSCDDFEEIDLKQNSNFTVGFPRGPNQIHYKVVLKPDVMNVHSINISEGEPHSHLFHLKFEAANGTENYFPVEVLFRYKMIPTLKEYAVRKKYSVGTTEIDFFVPEVVFKEQGLYHFAVLNANFKSIKQHSFDNKPYTLVIWKQVCLGKINGAWQRSVCSALETTDSNWIQCRCASSEMYAYSIPQDSEPSHIPISTIMEIPLSPLPIILLSILVFLYFVLLVPHCYQDKSKNLPSMMIPLIDNCSSHKQTYAVCVRTGLGSSSGTSSSVFIVLHGEKGMTETKQLIGCNQKKFSFQRGSIDLFLISTSENLGPLIKLEIWHNNTGISPSWYLKDVSIKDIAPGKMYHFQCDSWLSAEKDFGQIEKEIPVSDSSTTFIMECLEEFKYLWYDFHLWSSIVCEAIASTFTGVQKLTCCLCFILNTALFLFFLQDEIAKKFEDSFMPQISTEMLSVGLMAALIASIPQVAAMILFRFSTPPKWELDSKLHQIFGAVSLNKLQCWLKHKHSSCSRSESHSTLESSGSFYSSNGSSILSRSDFMEETYSSEEKRALSISVSSSDINDSVSPLQKTLSTWQVFENWMKRKNEIILNSEIVFQKRYSVSNKSSTKDLPLASTNVFNSTSAERPMPLQRMSTPNEDITIESQSNLSDSLTSEPLQEISASDELSQSKNALNFRFRQNHYFSSFWCYVCWIMLLSNIVLSICMIVIWASRSDLQSHEFLFLLQNIIISILCSCFIILPVFVLIASMTSSIKEHYFGQSDISHNPPHCHGKVKKMDSYTRIEYFKRYLRPPKEQLLLEFRKSALCEKHLTTFISQIWKNLLLLALLLSLVYPSDVFLQYSQRTSILKFFKNFADNPITSHEAFWNSVRTDFLDIVTDCPNPRTKECRFLSFTGCHHIGQVLLWHSAKKTALRGENDKKLQNITTRRKRHADTVVNDVSYRSGKQNFVVLKPSDFKSSDTFGRLISDIFNYSVSMSIDVVLFNPSTSTLVHVSLSLETSNHKKAKPNLVISPVKLIDHNQLSFHIYFTSLIILLIVTLTLIKTQVHRVIRTKGRCFSRLEFHHKLIITFTSIGYLICNIMCAVNTTAALKNLKTFDAEANTNLHSAAKWQTGVQHLIGALLFLHLFGMIKIFSFSQSLHTILRRITNTSKSILTLSLFFLILVFFSSFISKALGIQRLHANHLLWQCFRSINTILKGVGKPDIATISDPFNRVMCFFFLVAMIYIHFCFLALLRAIFLQCRPKDDQTKGTLKLVDLKWVIRKKFQKCFPSAIPQIVVQDESMLPMEFLLLELENLADKLMTKADFLFSESQPRNSCEDQISVTSDNYDLTSIKKHTCDVPKKLYCDAMASMLPAPSGGKTGFPIVPSSSVLLQRRLHTIPPCRIRKTYPLCPSDSSSSASEKKVSAGERAVRRTKSKCRNFNFDMDAEQDTVV